MKRILVSILVVIGFFTSLALADANKDGAPNGKNTLEANANATGINCDSGVCANHTQKDCTRDLTGKGCSSKAGNASNLPKTKFSDDKNPAQQKADQ